VRTQSLWNAGVDRPAFAALDADTQADVCIVGAGIAGLSTAYLLTQAGKSVVVIDDGEIGGGMTAVTSAHLTCLLDRSYAELEQVRGRDTSNIAARAHQAAINRIETIVGDEHIDCDFERVPAFLFRAPDDRVTDLDEELQAMRRAGLGEALILDRAPLRAFDTGSCITLSSQAQFHPLRYVSALARAVHRGGGEIYLHTHAEAIEGGDAARVQAGRREIVCDAVVVATNAPVNDRVAIHTRQAPYMTYVIAAEVDPGSVPRGLYYDTQDPYHYVRVHPHAGREYLVVGGEDHKSGQAEDTAQRHGRLEEWARRRFPSMGPVAYAWAGQCMQTLDGLAHIGRNPLDRDNVFVVTGDSGTGLTHGTIAGILLTDLILERRTTWADAFDPARKPVRAAGTFLKESANMAAQYGDWLKPGEVTSEDEIGADAGAVLRDGRHMVAAYRDSGGLLHRMTAVCNHLGCIVHWNAAESTWDCPCHGSRFDRYGRVINGPANRNLERLGAGKMRAG
jgi:glycine/D-amino acid oxidase-like deaminating enzyme/nitrite reductase/ring-hydroxylating ferredoxin subunit